MVPIAAGAVAIIAPMHPHFADEDNAPPSPNLAGCHLAIREDFLGVPTSSWRSGILTAEQADIVRPALVYIQRRSAVHGGELSSDLLGLVRGLLHGLRDFGLTDGPGLRPGAFLSPVKAALDLIARRWADPTLSVEDLAAAADLGVVRFRHVFREGTGLAPSSYLDRIRIDHARVLMSRKPLKNSALAQACGFGSESAFFRCYKRVRGLSPRADEPLG